MFVWLHSRLARNRPVYADFRANIKCLVTVSRSTPISRTAIFTDQAPKAIGPYSQAVRAGNAVYLSGQIALDPKSGELVQGGIDMEARRVFENLKAVAEASGPGLSSVVKITIYLTDLGISPK